MTAVKILFDYMSPEALHGIVEKFETRDGTDYGEVEVPLETKIAEVMTQQNFCKAVIVFDQKTESCSILRFEQVVAERTILSPNNTFRSYRAL